GVLEIERRSFGQPWSRAFFEKELVTPFARLTVAVDVGAETSVVGDTCRWRVAAEVHLLNVAVHPDRRGLGPGRQLVAAGTAGAGRVPRGASWQRGRATSVPDARLPRPGDPPRLLRAGSGRDRHGAPSGRPVSPAAPPDTSVAIGAVRLPNPVIAASGTFGYGTEFAGLVDLSAIGAISGKGRPLAPAGGKPAPRLIESPAGMLNAIGLQNIGVDAFLRERLPALAAVGARVVANFWGDSVEEFAACAARLDG